jgi:hypothetical protein
MEPRPDPQRWLVLAHLEHAPGGLDLGPDAPPGDEGGGEGGVCEVDRDCVVQDAPGASGR